MRGGSFMADNEQNDKLAQQEEKKGVVVRQYGLLPPLNWDQDCQEHLWLQNKFWNRLVEIENEHRDEYFRIMGRLDNVKEIEDEIVALKELKTRLVDEKKLMRQKARKKGVDTASQDNEIINLSKKIRSLSETVKPLRKEGRELLKPELDALEEKRREKVKEAYGSSGLWWGNYNAVKDSYNVARSRALKTGAKLKFHSFDGTGRFTVQIQGGMTVEEFFSGNEQAIVSADPVTIDAFHHPSRGVRRRAGRTTLRMTVYTVKGDDGKMVRRMLCFPMILHREIPSDAVIKAVVVSRKRVGTEFRWSATITCTKTGSGNLVSGKTASCGIDLGWRIVPEGLRVATIAHSEGVDYLVLPKKMLGQLDYIESLKSHLDQELNRTMTWFRNYWPSMAENCPEDLGERFKKHLRTPKISARRLSQTILVWRDSYSDFRPDLLSDLETWRKANKRTTQEMDNLRDKILARRTDFYRTEARKIVERFSKIGMEKFNLAKVSRVELHDGEKTSLPETARSNRVRASVSELRNWIRIQAVKTGNEIIDVPAKDTTRTCEQCGHINRGNPAEILWTCEQCGQTWDMDVNAAKNILKAVEK